MGEGAQIQDRAAVPMLRMSARESLPESLRGLSWEDARSHPDAFSALQWKQRFCRHIYKRREIWAFCEKQVTKFRNGKKYFYTSVMYYFLEKKFKNTFLNWLHKGRKHLKNWTIYKELQYDMRSPLPETTISTTSVMMYYLVQLSVFWI